MLIASLCILVAGLIVLAFGWRGRRVDDHPLCRKCGYDLSGRPVTSTVCSECGADVTRAKAVRVGHRVTRRWAIKLGGLAVLIAIAWPGAMVGLRMRGKTWLQAAPLWWVLREAGSAGVPERAAAMKELLRRRSAKELSDADIRLAVDRMLQWQGDAKRPWDTAWGDFIESQIGTRVATGEQKLRYTRQAVEMGVQFQARQKVRVGAALPLRFSPLPLRMGWNLRRDSVECGVNGIRIDGRPVNARPLDWRLSLAGMRFSTVDNGRCVVEAQAMESLRLAPGMHTVEAELTADSRPWMGGGRMPTGLVVGVKASVATTFTVVSGESVVLVRDPGWRQAEQTAISVSTATDKPGISHDFVLLNVRDLPVPVMADVVVPAEASPKARWEVIRLQANGSQKLLGPLSPRNGDGKRDVVLRPNRVAAEETVDLFEIWGEDIVLRVEMAPAK